MRFDILTLFPEMFDGPLTESIIKRAQQNNLIEIHLHNIRDFATDKHQTTDDTPYGGGGGMVMKAPPIVAAVEALLSQTDSPPPVILMTPQGRVFTQKVAQELALHERLVLVCGRYEGFDERVRTLVATDEISIGDYVLTGGELAAMVIVDAVARLVPGVLGARWGADDDSHATGLLEYPHYTRPPAFRGLKVPEALLGGNHEEIEKWRRQQSIRRTWQRRPDLLLRVELHEDEKWLLATFAHGDIRRQK